MGARGEVEDGQMDRWTDRWTARGIAYIGVQLAAGMRVEKLTKGVWYGIYGIVALWHQVFLLPVLCSV